MRVITEYEAAETLSTAINVRLSGSIWVAAPKLIATFDTENVMNGRWVAILAAPDHDESYVIDSLEDLDMWMRQYIRLSLQEAVTYIETTHAEHWKASLTDGKVRIDSTGIQPWCISFGFMPTRYEIDTILATHWGTVEKNL